MTITVDRGHYDCAGTNYAVISVRTTSPIHYNPRPQSQPNPQSFYCSFFSQKATRDMDTNTLHPHWLGNCSVYLGGDIETHASYRHESGHAKTWRKANKDEVSEGELSEDSDAVSVDPFPPANTNPNPTAVANLEAIINANAHTNTNTNRNLYAGTIAKPNTINNTNSNTTTITNANSKPQTQHHRQRKA